MLIILLPPGTPCSFSSFPSCGVLLSSTAWLSLSAIAGATPRCSCEKSSTEQLGTNETEAQGTDLRRRKAIFESLGTRAYRCYQEPILTCTI